MISSPIYMNVDNYDQMRAQTAGGDIFNNFAHPTAAGNRTGKLKIMTAEHLSSTHSSSK
jgi:hypothetical protein